jgi:hypothetical protein
MKKTTIAATFFFSGIVDSATANDAATGGKSFLLRDEGGSITCFFCEIVSPSVAARHTKIRHSPTEGREKIPKASIFTPLLSHFRS